MFSGIDRSPVEQVAAGGADLRVADLPLLVSGQRDYLVRAQGLFQAIGKPDSVGMIEVARASSC
jgi:hypothetical protein